MLAANGANGSYNVGPDDCDCVTTENLVNMFCKFWNGAKWEDKSEMNAPHEANFLKLDNTKIKKDFGWSPKWGIEKAVENTVLWYKKQITTVQQIKEFLNG
jgi:CDP-glucose 4,6-dehydratase